MMEGRTTITARQVPQSDIGSLRNTAITIRRIGIGCVKARR
jgi:hypothetical protein